ncbi:MAG TPA: hypothetical protein DCZ91_14280 [Lachnospiraceae bacterium]|nr:hypothetical protein [Lachnospiraceae bacterium]
MSRPGVCPHASPGRLFFDAQSQGKETNCTCMEGGKAIMENKDKKPYPWYDDRVTLLHEEAPAPSGWDDDDALSGDEGYGYGTPKEIYGYLDRHVCKQDAAKKAASIIAYNNNPFSQKNAT